MYILALVGWIWSSPMTSKRVSGKENDGEKTIAQKEGDNLVWLIMNVNNLILENIWDTKYIWILNPLLNQVSFYFTI